MNAKVAGLKLFLATVALLGAPATSSAQLDPDNVPLPPTDKLAALEKFFGSYEHSDQFYAGLGPFEGTLDVAPSVKGWYVEFVINTRFGPIDRQLRMLATWDAGLGHYRVWRFETTPQSPPGTVEAQAWVEDGAFIMEWDDTRGPDGARGTFRNRVYLDHENEIVIESTVTPEHGGLIRLGEWRNQRAGH